MPAATARIPVQVTKQQKRHFEALAKAAGLTTSEYLRRAADAYSPSEDEAVLERMIEQMARTTEQANTAIDDTLAYVEQSNQRIAAMEASARHRKVA